MIVSLFDRCLTAKPYFYGYEQEKPCFWDFAHKYLLHRCLIDKVDW